MLLDPVEFAFSAGKARYEFADEGESEHSPEDEKYRYIKNCFLVLLVKTVPLGLGLVSKTCNC